VAGSFQGSRDGSGLASGTLASALLLFALQLLLLLRLLALLGLLLPGLLFLLLPFLFLLLPFLFLLLAFLFLLLLRLLPLLALLGLILAGRRLFLTLRPLFLARLFLLIALLRPFFPCLRLVFAGGVIAIRWTIHLAVVFPRFVAAILVARCAAILASTIFRSAILSARFPRRHLWLAIGGARSPSANYAASAEFAGAARGRNRGTAMILRSE